MRKKQNHHLRDIFHQDKQLRDPEKHNSLFKTNMHVRVQIACATLLNGVNFLWSMHVCGYVIWRPCLREKS